MISRRKRLAAAVSVTAGLLVATAPGLADAQPAPKSGAAPAPAQPDKTQLAEAKKHMEAGAAFYNDPSGHKCEEAYREFLKAYELSGSLKALKAVGICALELERDGDAIDRFEKYLADSGNKADAADKAQVESDLKALKAAVAQVTLKSDRQGVQVTDVRTPSKGSPVTNDYTLSGDTTIGIHPGRHTFTATSEGAPSLTWTTEIANGGTYDHFFDFAKAAAGPKEGEGPKPLAGPTERPIPITVYVVGGLTAALTVSTVVLMARAKIKNGDYKEQNGTLSGPELETVRSGVTSANLVADIFLGASVASLAATGVLYFTRPSRPAAPKAGAWTVVPTASRSGGGALLLGRF